MEVKAVHGSICQKRAAAGANINYKTRLTRTKPITPSERVALMPFGFGRTAWEDEDRASFHHNSVQKQHNLFN